MRLKMGGMDVSDVILCRVDEAGAECVFCRLVCVVEAEFSEDVFAMGVDGMEAGEPLLRYLLGGGPQGNFLENFRFGLCEDGLLLYWLYCEHHLCRSLADEPSPLDGLSQALTNLVDRRLLE